MRRLLFVALCTVFASAADAQFNVPAPADVKAPPAEAQKTPSGLVSKVLKPGVGKTHPTLNDLVMVNYTGWTTDGKMFDTTVGKSHGFFPLNKVIRGWTEGLQLMVEGES